MKTNKKMQMKPDVRKQLSKLLTSMLRHKPERFRLVLDPEDGYCAVADVLRAVQAQPRWGWAGHEELAYVVAQCDKQRFALEDDRIRARYGHSYAKVVYVPAQPPAVLYHGTNMHAWEVIQREGLRPMGRQYVHLSEGTHFAALAGRRRGPLMLLLVDTVLAHEQGIVFYDAGHDVWLAEEVPPACLTVFNQEGEVT